MAPIELMSIPVSPILADGAAPAELPPPTVLPPAVVPPPIALAPPAVETPIDVIGDPPEAGTLAAAVPAVAPPLATINPLARRAIDETIFGLPPEVAAGLPVAP